MHNKISTYKSPFLGLKIERKPNIQTPFFPTSKSIKNRNIVFHQ